MGDQSMLQLDLSTGTETMPVPSKNVMPDVVDMKDGVPYPISIHVSDIHWRTSVPEYRKEKGDFSRVIEKKLKSMFNFATKFGKSMSVPIFSSGDLFDGARDFGQYDSLNLLFHQWSDDAKTQSAPKLSFTAVRGQHDMNHHNPKDKVTAFNALIRTGLIREMPERTGGMHDGIMYAYYGCGWGEEIPVPKKDNCNNTVNILIWHKTLWYKKRVFPGQIEGNIEVESKKLAKLGYSIVFSGDNHIAFDAEVNGVRFYNIGAFTRNSVDLKDQQPRFCVLYSDGSVESMYVGEKDVFELERSTDDKEHTGAKDEFSKALAGGFKQGDTFKGALDKVITAEKCGDLELTTEQLALLRDLRNNI